jgi:hypothetical protein
MVTAAASAWWWCCCCQSAAHPYAALVAQVAHSPASLAYNKRDPVFKHTFCNAISHTIYRQRSRRAIHHMSHDNDKPGIENLALVLDV